ncbi:MAG: hypothetical protein QF473_27835 [Planctomycetota bacterium]|jgi:hypothetical protein|nr:hypothetical protein [Planctomycetota bacterium]
MPFVSWLLLAAFPPISNSEEFSTIRPTDHCCFLTLSLHYYEDASLWVAIANANRDVEFPLKEKKLRLPEVNQAKQYAKSLNKERSFSGRIPWPALGVWDLISGQNFGRRWSKAIYIETERWAIDCTDFSSPDGSYVLAERKWTEHDEGRNWSLWLVNSKKKTGKSSIVNAWEGGIFEDPFVSFSRDSRRFVYRLRSGWTDTDLTEYMYIFGSVSEKGNEVQSKTIASNRKVAPSALLELSLEKAQMLFHQPKTH